MYDRCTFIPFLTGLRKPEYDDADDRYVEVEDIIIIKRKPPCRRRGARNVEDIVVGLKPPIVGQPMKLYQRPNFETANQVYRSQLASSLRAFQPKQWTPLSTPDLEPGVFRCRHVQPQHDRPSTSLSQRSETPTRLQRPKSVPSRSLRPGTAPADSHTVPGAGKYDTLSPHVLAEFMGSVERSTPDYEESPNNQSPLLAVIASESKQLADLDEDASTTSGIDSAASNYDSQSSDEESDDFDEPEIDSVRNIPELNLRPEKLDAIYVPEAKRGWRQFDFDMANIDLPAYEFQNPMPAYMDEVSLKQMAKLNWNWRNHLRTKTGPRDPNLDGVLDRVVELEKLQMDTIEWEQKRASQMKRAVSRRSNSAKLKDRRCCSQCLQATCFGDCPEKLVQSNTCDFCRQTFCTGTCKEMKYEQRMRQPRTDETTIVTSKPPFPRACSSCQRKHTAKYINANNLLLGQPRVNNSTFTRGQSSTKPKDYRPKSEPTSLNKDILKDFDKLGLDAVQPPRPNTATGRPRSRNSMFPGKSIHSQRKDSLTEAEKVINGKRKKQKASKLKRPKTAI